MHAFMSGSALQVATALLGRSWVAWGCWNTASPCFSSHGVLLMGFQPCSCRQEWIVCGRGLAKFACRGAWPLAMVTMDMAATAVH